jgi:signal transduction histidine kinase
MRERAELLGGTLEFTKPAQGGTLVRLRVPRGNLDGPSG